jgi:hypothetical protein
MQKVFYILLTFITLLFLSCGSIKSTLKNVDNTAVKPMIRADSFVITESSSDPKYGYDKDYPINLGFSNEKESTKNVAYFFNALTGINGEKISYEKVDSCCPFPTKRTTIGAGTLDIYEISIENNPKKIRIYINLFEKGKVLCPKGLSYKKYPTLVK